MRLELVATVEGIGLVVFLAVLWYWALRRPAGPKARDTLPSWKRYAIALAGGLVGLAAWHLLTQSHPGVSDIGLLVALLLGASKSAESAARGIMARFRGSP